MFQRNINLLLNRSFFLFGARGTGKSTQLKSIFKPLEKTLWIDLLDADEEEAFSKNHKLLDQRLLELGPKVQWVVIDEVQKLPKLLDAVHRLIETHPWPIFFALTGSSARKLKAGGANLLAGRATLNHLFPLTQSELGERFSLLEALQWGTLPAVIASQSDREKASVLRAYGLMYIKEEVWGEQLVRKMDPFRRFLEVAAQSNGKVISYANISHDVGVDEKSVKSYYSILEDTLLGFYLEPFKHSFRKRLSQKPKFYFFDTGVTRALNQTLVLPLLPQTSAFGEAFEHFVILEIVRESSYAENDFRFSYLQTKDGVEIDLVIERPGLPMALVEIKSASEVPDRLLKNLDSFCQELPNSEAICLCRESHPRKVGNVHVLPWDLGVKRLLGRNLTRT